ncbi:vitamin K epoxide reductase complex subunit 1-like protein 1 [Sitodiplosis mosellana]|uniref:vitamin K epoxide reductase complex subunit 1-like protein 1 n=1 Tax=Sitodiplosis mosellana TaxID=263140 RepID=UPI002444AE9F|nr:vitamin K epoxide reductase complex subunit 1-like protein 1 [Sitodiplosis mosellana]
MAGSIEQLSAFIAVACIIGCGLSAYSYYLTVTLEEDDEYEALCDISEHISCSKSLQSEYGRGFGLIAPYFGSDSFFNQPNGLWGLMFYTTESLLGFSKNPLVVKVQVILSILSIGISSWLGYVSYFELQNLCFVCVGLFIINIIIVTLTIIRHQRLNKAKKPATSSGTTKKKAPAKKGKSKKDQ